MALFRDLIYPPITLDRFLALRQNDPKRICFGSTHRNALKSNDNGKGAGFFNVPFSETIGVFFPWQIWANTRGSFGGYYRSISDQSEFDSIKAWIAIHDDLVFIRSLFNTAVATCEHYLSNTARSQIGELEHQAKYLGDASAKLQIVDVLESAFDRLHQESGINAVISVPTSNPGVESLPNFLAAQLGTKIGLPDMTASLNWNGSKPKIKELAVNDKWQALENVGLTVGNDIAGKNLLLIDDMYQSGATAHFVASCLRAAGANEIHLLAVSKGRRDTDNT